MSKFFSQGLCNQNVLVHMLNKTWRSAVLTGAHYVKTQGGAIALDISPNGILALMNTYEINYGFNLRDLFPIFRYQRACAAFDSKGVWMNGTYELSASAPSFNMARGIYCALGELAIHSPSPVYARRGLLDALREKCTETVPTPFTAQEVHAFSTAVFKPVPLSCISTVQKVLTEANPDFVDYIRFKVAAHA